MSETRQKRKGEKKYVKKPVAITTFHLIVCVVVTHVVTTRGVSIK